MKKEYFEIALRINVLFKQRDVDLKRTGFNNLRPKLKQQFIRFELFHESNYYQNLISNLQQEIVTAVDDKQFESAARNRSHKTFMEKRMFEASLRFQSYDPPCCLVDNNGLACCFLHSEQHRDLIMIITDLSSF